MDAGLSSARFTKRYASVGEIKSDGATYTPPELADFVADRIVRAAKSDRNKRLRILDPAVGEGELLLSLLSRLGGEVEVFGFETNLNTLEVARSRLKDSYPSVSINLYHGSFLDHVLNEFDGGLFHSGDKYDFIIANPPYVRTQILGANRAQELGRTFGLGGRIDLYQAFLLGIAKVLKPDGAAGIIASNRFMTTKGSGELRRSLLEVFRISEIFDLGDSKIFNAAVLPAVLIAKGLGAEQSRPTFTTVYETKRESTFSIASVVSALDVEGVYELPDGRRFEVQQGVLSNANSSNEVWRLASKKVDDWLDQVSDKAWGSFRDVGKVRVGVKTCADKVFIGNDWPNHVELLRPLTTHHIAQRFRAKRPNTKILYPHESVGGKKKAVDLSFYPHARRYLYQHKDTLEARTYVTKAGRQWYEIWVPQNPADWEKPKIIFRDISERPTFWMDKEGTVVNGDCYWITGPEDMLWLLLAVANSTFIERYYDRRFNNKLYAGRRRFITQYVEQFPVPDPANPSAQRAVEMCKSLYQLGPTRTSPATEKELSDLIWAAFGLPVEEV